MSSEIKDNHTDYQVLIESIKKLMKNIFVLAKKYYKINMYNG